MTSPISQELAATIYRILVDECGANSKNEGHFVSTFSSASNVPSEWRFSGNLGFGGKYRHPGMRVDCYPEDSTPDREAMISRANVRLQELGSSE